MIAHKHTARAVIRIMDRQDRLRRQLDEAEMDLTPHARRLMDAKGYRGILPRKALRDLAEGCSE